MIKKGIVTLMFIIGILGFSAKTGNANSYMDKIIGYWYYSKVGYQDPVGIRKLSNGTYQIGFNTGEKNADKNGFVIKDGNGNIIDYLDRKLNKLP